MARLYNLRPATSVSTTYPPSSPTLDLVVRFYGNTLRCITERLLADDLV
jgi:hypothetical protein